MMKKILKGLSITIACLGFPIPVSGYLLPLRLAFSRKLGISGIGRPIRVGSRVLGLSLLLIAVALPVVAISTGKGWITGGLFTAAVLLLVCLATASFVALCFQAAGTLMGGIILLFLAGVGQHFLAGGFLPQVFLPEVVRKLAPFLPSTILMDGLQMAVTADWSPAGFGKLGFLLLTGLILGIVLEVDPE